MSEEVMIIDVSKLLVVKKMSFIAAGRDSVMFRATLDRIVPTMT